MAPKWSDDLNLKFIELYKEQRCLWDQLDDLYKDKNARLTALAAMAEKLNIQGFGVAEVKAKIKAFRGTFNIELAKQQKSVKSGCGSTDVYEPTLKWFNAMKEVMLKGMLTRNTKNTLMPDAYKKSSTSKNSCDDNVTYVEPEPTFTDNTESEERVLAFDPADNFENSDSGVSYETFGDYPSKKKFKPYQRMQQIASIARNLKSLSDKNEIKTQGLTLIYTLFEKNSTTFS
ncbi:hypothetical protein HHI36_014517 [Cryptolaemus montrouzieri]|uniref:MADF domain-containing protein n=1 Tax=Cryptolaemus montrouzieri TaxID=559131 RepID=A0ABD2N3D1_9CUCU